MRLFSVGDDVVLRRLKDWSGKSSEVTRVPAKIVGANYYIWIIDSEYGEMQIDSRTGEGRCAFDGYIPEMAIGDHRDELRRMGALDHLTKQSLLDDMKEYSKRGGHGKYPLDLHGLGLLLNNVGETT